MTKPTKNTPDYKKNKVFLALPDQERWEEVCELLDFNIAGETNNKRLLFFLILGNWHRDYKSFVLYRGDSSAGKNYVIQNVLSLFPLHGVYTLDSATASALNYDETFKSGDIKLIYLRELEPQDAVINSLKRLYNPEGRIHKETVRDNETSEHIVKSHMIERMGMITTFSFENIKIDIINRGWVLIPDQSYEQTKDIVDFDINARKNIIERDSLKKKMLRKFFFIARCISLLDFEFKVYIPYIDKLSVLLPDTHLNVRRDKDKLFDLISIITLWNQKNRKFIERNDEKYLISEYSDLKMALEISQGLFVNLILHLDDTKRAILDYMEEFVVSEDPSVIEIRKYSITEIYEEIRNKMSVSRRTTQRKMNDLFYEGYLLREKEGSRYVFNILHDYDLIKMLKLDEIKDEIDSIVEQTYIRYSDKETEAENTLKMLKLLKFEN